MSDDNQRALWEYALNLARPMLPADYALAREVVVLCSLCNPRLRRPRLPGSLHCAVCAQRIAAEEAEL